MIIIAWKKQNIVEPSWPNKEQDLIESNNRFCLPFYARFKGYASSVKVWIIQIIDYQVDLSKIMKSFLRKFKVYDGLTRITTDYRPPSQLDTDLEIELFVDK